MAVFHLNVDVGEAKASALLQANRESECVTIKTKLQFAHTNTLSYRPFSKNLQDFPA